MVDETGNKVAAIRSMQVNQEVKALQTLTGMVMGMVADDHLHDREIQMLSTWLGANPEVTAKWPGSAIAGRVRAVLEDGAVTEAERQDLLAALNELVSNDFAQTGSVESDAAALPLEDGAPVAFEGATVVHTGEFLFGTRSQCERLSQLLGAEPRNAISRTTRLMVIGTRVSPNWITTSYGRKIQEAMELKAAGSKITIISERYWLECARAAGVEC